MTPLIQTKILRGIKLLPFTWYLANLLEGCDQSKSIHMAVCKAETCLGYYPTQLIPQALSKELMQPLRINLDMHRKSHLSLAWNCDPTSIMPLTFPQMFFLKPKWKRNSLQGWKAPPSLSPRCSPGAQIFILVPHPLSDTKLVYHMADGWENLWGFSLWLNIQVRITWSLASKEQPGCRPCQAQQMKNLYTMHSSRPQLRALQAIVKLISRLHGKLCLAFRLLGLSHTFGGISAFSGWIQHWSIWTDWLEAHCLRGLMSATPS
jgi:hypothetical protein